MLKVDRYSKQSHNTCLLTVAAKWAANESN